MGYELWSDKRVPSGIRQCLLSKCWSIVDFRLQHNKQACKARRCNSYLQFETINHWLTHWPTHWLTGVGARSCYIASKKTLNSKSILFRMALILKIPMCQILMICERDGAVFFARCFKCAAAKNFSWDETRNIALAEHLLWGQPPLDSNPSLGSSVVKSVALFLFDFADQHF